jgi:hypothetical protein
LNFAGADAGQRLPALRKPRQLAFCSMVLLKANKYAILQVCAPKIVCS